MSFTIWRLRFLIIYREQIDMMNQPGGITHPQVLEMDKKLMNLLTGLPAYFQLRSEDSKNWTFGDSCHDMELLSIQITGHNRILRLHRPYLARGLLDRNNTSRRRCVEAALNILALFRHAKNHAPILLRVWINIYYVFSGALVLFLDLCYDNDTDAKAADEKRRAVQEMLEICSEARHLSAAAKNTYNLLQGLLEAEVEVRGRQEGALPAAMGKRKRAKTGDSKSSSSSTNTTFRTPFVSLVERVLVDAATKHGSSDAASSVGKSPSESIGSFDVPSKRHSTSFVRDRASSHDGRQQLLRAHSMTNSTNNGGSNTNYTNSGAGHGGYMTDAKSPYNSRSGSSGGGGYPPPNINTGMSSSTPTSPWGPTSAIRGASSWVPRPGSSSTNTGFVSPTTSTGHGYNLLNSPTTPYQAGGNDSHSRSLSAFNNMSAAGGGPRTAATTNGLSSLLDEDIFSGLFMNQAMENSDWESAFAFVAPPIQSHYQPQPPPQQQQQQQHQQYSAPQHHAPQHPYSEG
jgi:hypothetical protein